MGKKLLSMLTAGIVTLSLFAAPVAAQDASTLIVASGWFTFEGEGDNNDGGMLGLLGLFGLLGLGGLSRRKRRDSCDDLPLSH